MTTDASKDGFGGTLYQKNNLVGLCSGKFNHAQSCYPPMELELIAIVYCLKKLKSKIFGSKIFLLTDNKNLLEDTPLSSSKSQR
jgi:hypothetical protein